VELSTTNARREGGSVLRGKICAFGVAAALNLSLILALACEPAEARTRHKIAHPDRKETERVSKEPFGDIPKGQLQIFVSINQQKLHLYSDGVHVADTSIATGVPSLPTPLGVFSVIQRQVFHRSNIYSNAPMPFMQRITWSGVAMHEGENIGHPASHGCIRMPREFAMRLYGVTKLGVRVIIARTELKPADFVDSHLFVHKDKPPPAVEAVKTAQSLDTSKTIDAAPGNAPFVKPVELGLRASSDGPASPDAGREAAKPTAPAVTDPAAASPQQAAAAASADANPPAANAEDAVPMPLDKPVALVRDAPARNTPIAIFISRKEKKIYVRQNFEPLFDAPVTIAHPEQPFGTHVFTAMAFLSGDRTAFRWNVVSLPGEPPKSVRHSDDDDRYDRHGRRRHRDEDSAKSAGELPPPQTPAQALARIDVAQDVIDHISEMMVPGSSLIVSDQGLGDETGEGTDFIVVTR
jgi:lipoprotein-anchoring transpeptidase ErfK/SrfK